MSLPELFQFHFSHYNEKARWALDFKGVPHRRRSLLPGFHAVPLLRISGQRQCPVLRLDGEAIAGSARILEALEERYPEPPLFPADAKQRERALEIERWFDEEVGPYGRRALFYEILPERNFLSRLACQGRSPLVSALYRASFPLTRLIMRLDMRIEERSAELARERTREALDFVVRHAGPQGYLVGESFSVADLTAASLLLLTTFPPEIQFRLPEPHPPGLERWLSRWADHPGVSWVRDIYRRHRGRPAVVGDLTLASP